MVNRPAGGARSQKWERSDYDWYIEPSWAVEQLMDRIDFGEDLIWDPCAGRGTVLDVAKARGHKTVASDIVDRSPCHAFFRANFISQVTKPPKYAGRACSIISNPPFGYEPDIAERIMRKAIEMPLRRAAFIVPIAFLASVSRWRFFSIDCKPSHVAIYSQRPTMPPGNMIDKMGDTAFKGGMADYCAVVFTAPHRSRTEIIWFQPEKA